MRLRSPPIRGALWKAWPVTLSRWRATPLPDGLSPHKLRHTFASLLVALGTDPRRRHGPTRPRQRRLHTRRLPPRNAPRPQREGASGRACRRRGAREKAAKRRSAVIGGEAVYVEDAAELPD
jgi:integrase